MLSATTSAAAHAPRGRAALIKCAKAILIAATVLGVLVAASYVTAHVLYEAVPEAREMSANISSHLDLGHIQRGLKAMKTYVHEAHWLSVLFYSLIFTIKTTFSIPGATPLCVIAGALFPWTEAVALCTVLVIVGSFFSYTISKYLLSEEVLAYVFSQSRVEQFRSNVEAARREHRLFWALLALRLFPLTPGSVINTFSPHVGVPVGVFAVTILCGNMPYILITTAAGDSLASIKDLGDIVSPRIMTEFSLLALISCVPVILKRRKDAAAAAAAAAAAVGAFPLPEQGSAYDPVHHEDSGVYRDDVESDEDRHLLHSHHSDETEGATTDDTDYSGQVHGIHVTVSPPVSTGPARAALGHAEHEGRF